MIRQTPVASSVPFTNSQNNFEAVDSQSAIEEALPFNVIPNGCFRRVSSGMQMVIYEKLFVDGQGVLEIDGEVVIL